jgi:hypothetical protein
MDGPSLTRLTDFCIPNLGIQMALHRRKNSWYIVLARAYGMANGNRLCGILNSPLSSSSSVDPPQRHPNLNPRIWLRDDSVWAYDKSVSSIDRLLSTEPPIFKDSGLARKVEVKDDGGVRLIEERLVEVLLKEEELCQRCAWCGYWEEVDYHRHRKAGEGSDGRPLYWCGVSFSNG